MTVERDDFQVGFEFESVLAAISKQIYETPLAFIRENVQNAIDALRMRAAREGLSVGDPALTVQIRAEPEVCEITDNGIGMTLADLQNLFWTIGASGKRSAEARAAGCVGMFGIGGFANLGVCDELTVISHAAGDDAGHWTRLSREEIEASKRAIPAVAYGASDEAAPQGTLVRGKLSAPADVAELDAYVRDFVQFAEEHVYFNGVLVSRQHFNLPSESERLQRISVESDVWTHGSVQIHGALYEGAGHKLFAEIDDLVVDGEPVPARGWLGFENGPIDILKRSFKICAHTVGTRIGVRGAIDCDLLAPTAGRDSLDAPSASLVSSIALGLERAAVVAVLNSSDRIEQHTRIFKYVRVNGLVPEMGRVRVRLADGDTTTLGEIKRRHDGGVNVFVAASQNKSLSQILHARGNVVAQLPADGQKRAAVLQYLQDQCSAEQIDGRVECAESYEELARFEKAFLSEVEEVIARGYDVGNAVLIPGKLTEDIPVFAQKQRGGGLTIYVDVRHAEVSKLGTLGITPLFSSMVAAFCREYLGPVLRSQSPKYFGSGAINLELLAKRRSELWVLVTDEIEILTKGTQRDVVRPADVQVVRAGDAVPQVADPGAGRHPKLVCIEGSAEFSELFGYYLRIPNAANHAYGDVILECESRGVVWAGNKIMFVASDAVSSAFQFEVRVDRLIAATRDGQVVSEGAATMERPLQALFEGLYFPVPPELEDYLVPAAEGEIRIEVRCDWIDFATAKAWQARQE